MHATICKTYFGVVVLHTSTGAIGGGWDGVQSDHGYMCILLYM